LRAISTVAVVRSLLIKIHSLWPTAISAKKNVKEELAFFLDAEAHPWLGCTEPVDRTASGLRGQNYREAW
jgi:hypothetical protein